MCTLAGLTVAATILLHRAGHERQVMERQALALARSTAFAAEREVAATFARLEGLSAAPALRSGNMPALHVQLARTPAPPGSWFVVADASGQVLNTLLADGNPRLPQNQGDRPAGMTTARVILEKGQRSVGGASWAPVAQIHTVAVGIPVTLGPDSRRGALMASVPQTRMLTLLQEQPLPPQWRATLVDQFSNVVARVEPVVVLGSPVPPGSWSRQLKAGPGAALFTAADSAGTPALVAIAPAGDLGWTAVVEVPLAVLEAPWREALVWIFLSAAVLLLLGLLAASQLRARIDHSVSALAQAADAAEERQREIAARFRHYWDHTSEGLFIVQAMPDGTFVFECMNPVYERVAGLRSAGAAAAMQQHFRQCTDAGVSIRFLELQEASSGNREWETILSPMHDPRTGYVTALLGTTHDITEHRRANGAVRRSEERLRLAQRAAGAVVWDYDADTERMYWSPELREFLGVAPDAGEQVSLKAFLCALIHPEDRRHVEARLRAALAKGGQFEAEFRYARGGPGGELRWMAARGGVVTTRDDSCPIFGSGLPKRCLVGVIVDVTERRKAELAAQESLTLVQGSLNALVAQVAVLDVNWRIIAANDAWRRMTAAEPSMATNLVGSDYVAACKASRQAVPETVDLKAGLHAVTRGAIGEFRQEYAARDPATDQQRWFQIRITRFGESTGLRLVVTHEDVTEVRRSADALKAMAGQLLTLQDEERRRIARELHDTTLQDLAMAALSLDVVMARGEGALAEARALLEQAMRDVRTLSYLLHPPLLDVCGLTAALSAFAEGFARRSGLNCELDLEETPPTAIPSAVGVALFRVAQEAFANVHRHSGARRMRVILRLADKTVELRVEDDGKGFDRASLQGREGDARTLGVGIPGMRARIRQLQGELDIKTGPKGTMIVASVPLCEDAKV
jgi:PAS domain S-box-containing protein